MEPAFSLLSVASVWFCDSLKEDPATSVVVQLHQFLFRSRLLVRLWRAKYLVVQSRTHHRSYLTKTPGGWHWGVKFQVDLAVDGRSQILVVGLSHLHREEESMVCFLRRPWSWTDICWVPEGAERRSQKLALSRQTGGLTQCSLCTVESWSHSDYQGRMALSSLFPYQDREVSY